MKPPSHLRTANFPLTIAAPSFINDAFLPMFAARCTQAIRSLNLPPALMEQFAAERIIDAAVSIGIEGRLPRSWSSEKVGAVHYGLFGSPALVSRLGLAPSRDEILDVPFVSPLFVRGSGVLEVGDDRCPLSHAERTIGHEVESIGLACQVAAQTDHLVYGPRLAAAALVHTGALVELDLVGFRRADPLFLACSPEGVTTSVQIALVDTIQATFAPSATEVAAVSLAQLMAEARPSSHHSRRGRT